MSPLTSRIASFICGSRCFWFRFICRCHSESESKWSLVLSKASTCQSGKRLETMAGRNAVRNTIGASHRESMTRSGRALFRGCFGTTAAMCVGRAVGLEAHRPLLSTDTVQMVLLACAITHQSHVQGTDLEP